MSDPSSRLLPQVSTPRLEVASLGVFGSQFSILFGVSGSTWRGGVVSNWLQHSVCPVTVVITSVTQVIS